MELYIKLAVHLLTLKLMALHDRNLLKFKVIKGGGRAPSSKALFQKVKNRTVAVKEFVGSMFDKIVNAT